jgi:hypothetical protein
MRNTYQIFDNNKPAVSKAPCWATNEFETLEEAQRYARDWLGQYGEGLVLLPGILYDYDGYGSNIEIRLAPATPEFLDRLSSKESPDCFDRARQHALENGWDSDLERM